ncbi:MAG: DUF177 domain-containing protein [Lentisphaerae bacterium]|nr:DUF177 domain-containing protein [Victivallaceae bacterium]NLK83818.1 DUF177 domain-containing protein [Lentisphaerota bacterium]
MNRIFKISLAQLERERKLSLTGTVPAEFLGVPDTEMLKFNHPVEYDLELSVAAGGVVLKGSVTTAVQCFCGRCLGEFTATMKATICHFYEKSDAAELDIATDIREDILLETPMNPICGKDCKGLCLQCGKNLNLEACSCDNMTGGHPVWDELDKLKKKK